MFKTRLPFTPVEHTFGLGFMLWAIVLANKDIVFFLVCMCGVWRLEKAFNLTCIS